METVSRDQVTVSFQNGQAVQVQKGSEVLTRDSEGDAWNRFVELLKEFDELGTPAPM